MSSPRQADVWHKKQEVADRTLNERKYCKLCDYFYSEMFTCPICYGEQRATERIIKLLETEKEYWIRISQGRLNPEWGMMQEISARLGKLIALIKGEQNV